VSSGAAVIESEEPTIAFRVAVEARDPDLARAALAPQVRFFAPIRYRPFVGRDEVAAVLAIPATLFAFHDSFRYTRTLSGADGWHGLFFEAEIEGRRFEGVDYLQLDANGLVAELRVMMRPLAEVQAFAAAAAELAQQLL
jgi:hypothetical protein